MEHWALQRHLALLHAAHGTERAADDGEEHAIGEDAGAGEPGEGSRAAGEPGAGAARWSAGVAKADETVATTNTSCPHHSVEQ
jgi:hypothetical protein